MYSQWLSHVWLCNPMHRSLPDSSVHGIFQVRILEWVAISFSRGSSWLRNRTHVSCVSCIGRQILYCWTTWEAHICVESYIYSSAWIWPSVLGLPVFKQLQNLRVSKAFILESHSFKNKHHFLTLEVNVLYSVLQIFHNSLTSIRRSKELKWFRFQKDGSASESWRHTGNYFHLPFAYLSLDVFLPLILYRDKQE